MNPNSGMKKTYNWGILAPGKIARKFALELQEVGNAKIYAVASRDRQRAKDFAAEFGAARAYDNYRALAADPDVDVIYIASPHSFHHEHAKLCLENKKAVLCEKALALNQREVEDMIACAAKNRVFLMEAFTSPQQPSYKEARKMVESGALGKIKYIHGWFGFNKSPYSSNHRLLNPQLGGGALLDIGLYPVFDVLWFLGNPLSISTSAEIASTGVDQSISARFEYPEGVSASIFASFYSASGVGTDILCEKGTLRLRRSSAVDQWLEIDIPGEEVQCLTWDSNECGLKQEALEVMNCLESGRLESNRMPHSMSLRLMKILDHIRRKAGIVYTGRD
jgi:predicted dehydrogenase